MNTIGPRSCYDESKRAGEAFAKAYELQHNIDVRFVRIFNTYGPRIRAGKDLGRALPNFIEHKQKPLNLHRADRCVCTLILLVARSPSLHSG